MRAHPDLAPQPDLGRRRFLRGGALLGGAIALGGPTLLAACGDDDDETSSSGSGSGSSAQTLTFQLGWLKGVQHGGHFAAIEQGYFTDAGIEPTFDSGGPNIDQIAVVSSGQALVGDSGSDELVVARASGIPVRAFAAGFQKSPYSMFSLADSPVTSLEELPGKTVAVSDGSRAQIEGLLEGVGVDPTSVNFVPKNPDPSVLADGIVDVYTGFSTNEAAVLRLQGVDVVTTFFSDLGAPTYANVFFTTDEALEENRDLLIAFLRADVQGWQWAIDNPVELAEVVVDKYAADGLELEPQTAEAEAQVELIDTGDATEHGLFWIAGEVFEANIASALDGGLIDEAIDPEDVFTQELIAEVHGA